MVAGFFDGHRKQVRTFPNAAVLAVGHAPVAEEGPVDQVGRPPEFYPVIGGKDHDPLPGSLIPNDLGVSEVPDPERIGDHGVTRIFGPGAPLIMAVSDTLVLKILPAGIGACRVVVGKNGNEGRLPVFAQTTGIVPVHHRTTGEDVAQRIGI